MKYIAALFGLALCAGAPVSAQDAAKLPLVGVLRINTPDTIEPMATQFRADLAARGQVDGRTIRLEYRLAEGHVERFPGTRPSAGRRQSERHRRPRRSGDPRGPAGDPRDPDRRDC